jgi:hypothetical protein
MNRRSVLRLAAIPVLAAGRATAQDRRRPAIEVITRTINDREDRSDAFDLPPVGR